ncbi:MAG TPA: type IV pilus assembly protein PilM [Acidimicrobiales bacterium]|jgi:type IV pilus assembly protein PilM|nr:type IV pilus assembly protein PilM [Acidimicrobiales bacterium]
MPTRVVGLDLGTYAVRAVELLVGGQPTLVRFAQATLPPGAIRDGEVVDVAAVSAAVRRLWADGGFKTKRVVLGVANQRVIVRQAELPAMSESDLQAALRFEAQELIPIPVEDAILDSQILEELVSPEGEPRMRILLAAAQRDMVRTHLAAVEGAGLSAVAVDVIPFALVRSLFDRANQSFTGDGSAEAIVCIGGGVTNVVVHEQGVPRFVRVLLVGGDDVTEAIARDLDVDVDTAEDLKRRADIASPDASVARAGQVVSDRLTPLVEEIRGSLDYYLAQSQSSPIGRVLVTGGGSRLPGLMERLQSQLGGRVEPAHPLANLKIGQIRLSQAQLAEYEPLMTVPIGLALAAEPQKGVRRISLLPSEVAVVREQRRQAALAFVGVAGLGALLIALWAARQGEVSNQKKKADEAEQQATRLEAQRSRLRDASSLETEIQQRQSQITTVMRNDVAWTRVFNDIATVVPADVWLTGFQGQKVAGGGTAAPATGTGTAARTGTLGTITFQGKGFDQTSTARWLLRVGDLREFIGLWVPNSTKSGEGALQVVTFSSSAQITTEALSKRVDRYTGTGQ